LDKKKSKEYSEIDEDSQDSLSYDMNEIKLQHAVAIHQKSKKRNVVSKDDQMFGIVPIIDDLDQKSLLVQYSKSAGSSSQKESDEGESNEKKQKQQSQRSF
jgi:hypothetical protein